MIRVFLADDHAIVRDGLRQHINDEADMKVVGETGDGLDVLRRAATEEWDVLILDLSLPGCPGIEVAEKLHASKPQLPIVVLSMYPESQHGPHLMRIGAAAYLGKGRAPNEILNAIRKVASGEKYMTSEVASSILTADRRQPHTTLSPRERQIFMLLANGRSPSEIAGQLDLAATTVSTFLGRIREKLEVESNTEIVQYAYREKIVE